jgi:hypothetical protein
VSETGGSRKGSVTISVALREWPDTEKQDTEWEDRAQSVMNRLRRGERGATTAYIGDSQLLVAPLGQSTEDGHNAAASGDSEMSRHARTVAKEESGTPMTMPADRERDRRSLKDLAKMASGLTPPPSSVASLPSGVQRAAEGARDQKDDSGIVDLAAASQADVGAAARAQSTPLASQGIFEEPHQPPPSMPPMSGVPGSIPPSSGHYHATPSAPPVGYYGHGPASVHPLSGPLNKKKSGGATIAIVIGGLVAFSAAAAGSFMYLRTHKLGAPTATAPATTPAEPATRTEPTPPPTPTVAPTPVAEPSSDSNTTAHGTAPAKASAGKIASAKPGAKVGAAKEPGAAAAAKTEAVAAAEPATLPPSPSMPGDLGAAIKKEIGDEPAKTPAAGATGGNATGNVPQKPSQGAVTGALGAVLPQARTCLGPDDPISRASVVFTSGGAVQSISVSGGAAGKPAETCIKDALSKAKLQPFAEPTYTANITIRHN